jgi:SNF2 family DNA or RNA helicase
MGLAVQVSQNGGFFYVKAPYELREACRSLPGRVWKPQLKQWRIPATTECAHKIAQVFSEHAVSGDEEFQDLLRRAEAIAKNSSKVKDDPIEGAQPGQWRHQRQAFWFAKDRPAALLDMGMGTGKTRVVIDLICHAAKQKPIKVLVLCPLSVVPVWPTQIQQYGWDNLTYNIIPLDASKSVEKKTKTIQNSNKSADVDVIIVNYESAKLDPLKTSLLSSQWDFVILDESHKIKGQGSKVSQFCATLRSRANQRLCLTGTPMPHSPLDIYAQFRFLDPGIFGTSFALFRARYAIMGGFTTPSGIPVQVLGFQNQDELASNMDPVTFKAKTEDVLDLPGKTHVERYYWMGKHEAAIYKIVETDFIAKVKNGEIVARNALTKIIRLAQIASGYSKTEGGDLVELGTSKRDALQEVISDIGPEPIVVFCRFHHDLDAVHHVAKNLKLKSVELSGRRNELGGPKWLDGNGDIIAVQLQSGGVGIDLTRTRYCIYYAVDYSLGNYEQSLARVHRPGQTRPVTYIHLVGKGTIDTKVYASLRKKKDVIESILSQICAV